MLILKLSTTPKEVTLSAEVKGNEEGNEELRKKNASLPLKKATFSPLNQFNFGKRKHSFASFIHQRTQFSRI